MQSNSGWAIGFTAFAAILMVLIGAFQAVMGLVAVFNQEFYVATPNYVFAFDVGTWGWIHLIFGVVVLIAGFALLGGAGWARGVAAVLAGLSAIEAFLFLPYQPFWSLAIIALSVMIIWAVTTQIEEPVDSEPPADTGV
jgi:hypothetical protein